MKKISIIIPVYNVDHKRFKKTLDSLVNQTSDDFEVCISDGGLKSDVKTIVDEYSEKLDIKYDRSEKNLGISDNTNAALKLANGEYDVYVSMISLSHVFSHKFANWKVENNVIVSESLYSEINNLVTIPNLDKQSINELVLMSEQTVNLAILDYIKNIQIPINFLKYMKIRQYLVSTKNNTLLDYLQYSFQQLLKDDLYEELK